MQKRFWPLYILISVYLAAPIQSWAAPSNGGSASGYQMYKWTDDKGQVHFGDSIPAQYLDKKHDIINDEGQTVQVVQAAPTKQQLAEKARLARIAKEKKQKEAAQEREDRMLMDTYTTERDLIAARDARFQAVDSQIRLAESNIADAQKKLDKLQKQAKAIKAHGGKVPEYLAENIKDNEDQIATQEDVRKSRVAQRKQIKEQFTAYIKRFRVLKAQEDKRLKELEAQDQ